MTAFQHPRSVRTLLVLCLAAAAACSSSPAPGGASRPSAEGARRQGGPLRVVLVEADGTTQDVEAFVSRFASEASDRGAFTVADARLAGGRMSLLGAEPTEPGARAFREAWPADAYLGLTVSPCQIHSSSQSIPETSPEGYRYNRLIVSVRTECSVSLTTLASQPSAASGGWKRLAPIEVKGTANFREEQGGEDAPSTLSSEEEALREAATKARKLGQALPR